MGNISDEELKKYMNILELEINEDLETIVRKYKIAIIKYMKEDTYDIEKLSLIIKAFKFFSGFDKNEFDVGKISDIAISLLENLKTSYDCYSYEIICMCAFVIGRKLNVLNNLDGESRDKDCKVLYQLMTTIEPIMNFELEQFKK